MNDSFRRVNPEIKMILEGYISEPAFNGTAKEGFERKYTVINERDINRYVPHGIRNNLSLALDETLDIIEKGRVNHDKKPYNNYIVINLDEPYADEVIEIMKKNGHWG